jgi:hypothetical protein
LFIRGLQVAAADKGFHNVQIRTEHHRNGAIFRGHPNFRKKGQWNDWAMFNWAGGHGRLPGEIECFVDLSSAPANFYVQFGGIRVKRGVYAVIESTHYEPDEQDKDDEDDDDDAEEDEDKPPKSEMFRPITKDLDPDAAEEQPMLYLADVESIVSTCCVFPDIGSDNRFRYYVMTPRSEWSNLFKKWLMQQHYLDGDQMEASDEEE